MLRVRKTPFRNWTPAVNRQPGYRRGPRRAPCTQKNAQKATTELLGAPTRKLEKCIFLLLKQMLSALSLESSELILDLTELYEVPGGNLVDGLPPAPSWPARPEKNM